MKGDNLSHEEVWDDSALLNSWDDALAEYKKYHSMAANGERVNISDLESDEKVKSATKKAPLKQQAAPTNGTLNATTTEQTQTVVDAEPTDYPSIQGQPAVADATPSATAGAPSIGSAMPQALLGAVQDDGMKNLMMSWYYAGYYTGLLEGQQKAYASMQEGG